MEQGRASTIKFNEWICVCAQYEKAVARLGRQVYQGYSRGLVRDHQSMEMCKEISTAFGDSKQIRADMEEELERDALRGLSVEEAKAAEEILELTQGEKITRSIKLQITKFLGKGAVNRSLQSYRDRVRDLSRDLGLRALAMYEKDDLVLKMDGHRRLCQLALNLDAESNKKWEEITKSKSESGALNLSFHTQLISFLASFANYSRGTPLGKVLLKALKYDAKEEEKKLTKQFEGSKTAEALEAQMAELDEPYMDIGREMATMERDYVSTPTEWGLPPRTSDDAWIPDTSDTWGSTVEEAPAKPTALKSTTPVPAMPPKPTAAPGDGPKPQVLRQRRSDSLSGAEAWAMGNSTPEPEAWSAPAAPAGPTRIGQAPAPSSPVAEDDDWGSSTFDPPAFEVPVFEEPATAKPNFEPAQPADGQDWSSPEPAEDDWSSEAASSPVDDWAAEPMEDDTPIGPARLGGTPTLSGGPPAGFAASSRTPTLGGGPPVSSGQRPQAPAPPRSPARPQTPAQSQPAASSQPQPPTRPLPSMATPSGPGQVPSAGRPASPVRPQPPQPPSVPAAGTAPPQRPSRPTPPPGMVPPTAASAKPSRPMSIDDIPRLPISSKESLANIPLPGRPIPTESMISAPRLPISHDSIAFPARGSAADDPLLKLLRNDSKAAPVQDDDDLLPAFLRERKDDDPLDGASFIPDLPDSVDSGLKILPFGSQPKGDDDPPEPFIPQMPD